LKISEPDKGSLEELSDEGLRFTGTQINYYFVCKRKLWLFSHNMEFESESDLVQLGRLLHEQGYKRKLKEVQVDRIKMDFLEREKITKASDKVSSSIEKEKGGLSSILIHEVKRSKSMQNAHIFQLLYYIYYLKNNYNVNAGRGILHYPLLKTNISVQLTEGRENQLRDVLNGIRNVISQPNPPVAVWMKPCRSCAYMEMCWG
jgi:CRISPR-associated exonuclease Cas4